MQVAAEVGNRRGVEEAPAGAYRGLAVSERVEGESKARREILLQGRNDRARHAGVARINQAERRSRENRRAYTEAELLVFIAPAEQLPVHLVAKSEIQGQFPGNFPVVLEEAEEVAGVKIAILSVVLPERIGAAEQKIGQRILRGRTAEADLSGAKPVAGLDEKMLGPTAARADAMAAAHPGQRIGDRVLRLVGPIVAEVPICQNPLTKICGGRGGSAPSVTLLPKSDQLV